MHNLGRPTQSASLPAAVAWLLGGLLWVCCLRTGLTMESGASLASAMPAGMAPTNAPPAEPAKTSTPKVYKYLASGVASFSDIPPRRGAYIVWSASCYACNLNSTINWHATKLHLKAYAELIELAAKEYRLDPALVRAVIHAESGFDARARSHKGAVGLMQLMPATARAVGVTDARVPTHNIRGGAQYLAGLLARFRGDITLATAAYNAGPGAVEKYAGIPPYAETQAYVQRVKILHRRYRDEPQS